MRRRMGECGLSDCPTVALELFDTHVRPVMSYGAEAWAPQLVLQALKGGKGGADACERVHLDFLRRLLGVRDTLVIWALFKHIFHQLFPKPNVVLHLFWKRV